MRHIYRENADSSVICTPLVMYFFLRWSLFWALRPITQHKPTQIFMVTKQRYINSSLDVVFCLRLHIHNHIEYVLIHIIVYVHDVKIMTEEIGLPIRKLLENRSFYLVVGQTKTRKLLLTRLKTKHNVTILWHHVIQFFTKKTRGCNILFNSTKKSFLFFLYLWFVSKKRRWQLKKDVLPSFISVNAFFFSCTMDMLVFHACSNHKPLYKLENHW